MKKNGFLKENRFFLCKKETSFDLFYIYLLIIYDQKNYDDG